MTAHFIEESTDRLVMNDRILCTREMDAEKKDGPYIKSQIKEHLKSFDLYSFRKNVVFVSDRGTNMVSALTRFQNIHCFAHMLNNSVQKILEIVKDEIAPVKALVKYFKVTGLNSQLDETLKSYVPTRWNSVFYMIKSVLANWDELNVILLSKGELERVATINVETLKVHSTYSTVDAGRCLDSDFILSIVILFGFNRCYATF